MSDTLHRVRALVSRDEFLISRHGYRELAADDILAGDVLAGVGAAIVVEDYADAERGPSVLLLQHEPSGGIIHAVWGISKGAAGPAVLVTAYRPDPQRWSADFTKRVKR